MNCCNNGNKSEKETDSENREDKKISRTFIIMAIILIGLLLFGILA